MNGQGKYKKRGKKLYFEDLVIDKSEDAGSYYVTKEEVIAFSQEWDPQPFHIDEAAAKASIFGCLTGSSIHMKAVLSRVIGHGTGNIAAVANLSTSYNMPNPMRVGDTLYFTNTVTDKRLSNSRPGIGIVGFAATAKNQNDEIIMNHESVVMVECKPVN